MDKDKEKSSGEVSIAYQNKDISSKYMASLHGTAFAEALGIDMAPLYRNEPTELPAIEVSNMMMDNLFLLTDGTYVIVDYESKYSVENKIKYLNYLARLVKTLYNRNKDLPKIQILVIYTADVEEGKTDPILDLGEEKLFTKEIFLSSWDTKFLLEELEDKAHCVGSLTEVDTIRLAMLPLSAEGKDAKVDVVNRCIDIIEMIDDEDVQLRLYGGLIAFTDKCIDIRDKEEVKRRLSMTTIEKMYYDEKIEAVNKATSQQAERIATNLLCDGLSKEAVSRNTGLDIATVEGIAKRISAEKTSKDAVTV